MVRKSGYVHAAKKKCDSWHVVDDVRGVRDVRLRRDGISMHEAGVGMRENPFQCLGYVCVAGSYRREKRLCDCGGAQRCVR